MRYDDYFSKMMARLPFFPFLVMSFDFTLTTVRTSKKVKVRLVRKTPGWYFYPSVRGRTLFIKIQLVRHGVPPVSNRVKE